MKSFKIATWNVNSLRVRLPHVLQWLATEQPDVLALQELKMPTEDFPLEEIRKLGYDAIVNGQKTYNGVAILCKGMDRHVQTDIVMDIPVLLDPQRRVLAVTVDGIRILNLYVPNGESIQSEKYQYKLKWLTHLNVFLQRELQQHSNVIILGDFNIAPENSDVHDPKAWEGQVLFSEPERREFQSMLQLGFADCFRLQEQPEKIYSWWDYRLNAFKRNLGLRIDHILASTALAKQCKQCIIDKMPRGWERPSDHAPVIAQFEL
jgi:exodeoxyribonuclease-3